MLVVVVIIVRTNFMKEKTTETVALVIEAKGDNKKIMEAVSGAVPVFFDLQVECMRRTFDNFFEDNEFKLRKARNKASNVLYQISKRAQ